MADDGLRARQHDELMPATQQAGGPAPAPLPVLFLLADTGGGSAMQIPPRASPAQGSPPRASPAQGSREVTVNSDLFASVGSTLLEANEP